MIRLVAVAAMVLAMHHAPPAHAQGGASMRAVVRVVRDADKQLLSRIHGQVADLDATLVPVSSPSLARSGHARFEQARRLAAQHRARVVVWFEAAGTHGVRVYVAEPGRDSLFARRIVTADASARAEAIAIIVRSSLRALAMGGQIGVRVPRRAPTTTVAALPVAPRRRAARWIWNLGVHGQLSFDGASSPAQRGFMGRLDASRGSLVLGVAGVASLTDQLRDDVSVVHLARHSLGVTTAWRMARTPRTALYLGVDAGAVAYTRSTTVIGGGLTATPPTTTWAASATATARGQWRPAPSQPLWLTLEVGVAGVLGAPELRYEVGGTTVVRNQLWPVQPHLGLGVRLEGL